MKNTIARLVVAASLFAIVGCGSSTTAPASTTAATRSSASIGVSGGHLVDANGFALYDTPATCTGSCLTIWPPFDAGQVPVAKAGVSQAAIAVSAGQVTYNGHLLFYFDTDTTPGMINGSGVNGFTLVSP
jgi:predicted lipoprotein with Yx(FWY)xxD motif